jgi:hypothetical protein
MNTRLLLLLTVILFSLTAAFAQRVIDVDNFEGSALHYFRAVGGEPLMNTKFVRLVQGTPYFSDKWMKGSVFIEDSEYRNFNLRVNTLETTLEFMDRKGEQMICTMPVKRVVLNDSLTGTRYTFVHGSFLPENPETRKSWLIQLDSGAANLYKLEKKQVNEIRPYGSATTEQHILSNYFYFVLYNNELRRIKKVTEVPDFLSSRKNELNEYIKTNRPNIKSEKDMIRFIEHYNSLQ